MMLVMEGGKGIRVLWSTALTRLNRHRKSITRSRGQSSRIPTPTKVSTLRKQKQNGSLQVNETSQVSFKKKKITTISYQELKTKHSMLSFSSMILTHLEFLSNYLVVSPLLNYPKTKVKEKNKKKSLSLPLH